MEQGKVVLKSFKEVFKMVFIWSQFKDYSFILLLKTRKNLKVLPSRHYTVETRSEESLVIGN